MLENRDEANVPVRITFLCVMLFMVPYGPIFMVVISNVPKWIVLFVCVLNPLQF